MAYSFNIAVILQRKRRRMNRRSTGKRREICKSHEPWPEIPFDLVIEILTRLPAKSLMRFKSVSKLWSSLICSRNFTNPLLKVSSSSMHLYMTVSFYDNSQLRSKLLSSALSPPGSDITTTMSSSFVTVQDLTTPAMKGYYIAHLFRGLMCLVNEKARSAQIYNTTTRQLFVLPEIKESKIIIAEDHTSTKTMYHIGHEPVHDQYKVVCIVARSNKKESRMYESEHWVLLLGGDIVSSRWRKITSSCTQHMPLTQAININGCMHYLARVRLHDPMLVSFDLCSEETSMLQAPDILFYRTDPIEYCGKVAILDYINLRREGRMKLWVMEEDANKNVWWSEKTLELQPSQIHLVNNNWLMIQGTTRNGEVIFLPDNLTHTRIGEAIVGPQKTTLLHYFLYDFQKNLMRRVDIIESPYHNKLWNVVGLDDVENLMHLSLSS